MMRARSFGSLLASTLLAGLLGWGCTIEGAGATGKACQSALDCPEPLTCVSVRPTGRTCELLDGPTEGNFDRDAGVAYWCTEIQPFMDAYCTACHTAPPTNSAPANFRLDLYEEEPGGIPGAKETAERSYVRTVVTRDMPPFGWPQPTEEERQLLTAWFRAGAPECATGADAGM